MRTTEKYHFWKHKAYTLWILNPDVLSLKDQIQNTSFHLPNGICWDLKKGLVLSASLVNVLTNCTTSRMSRVRLPIVSLNFFIDVEFPVALCHWGHWANRNKYNEYFLALKSARAEGWQLLLLLIFLKSENLKHLDPSGLFRTVMGLLYLFLT
jgi:hypothetical protein